MRMRDRVWETSTTTGTGDVTLLGAVVGYRSFAVAGYTLEIRFPYLIEGVTVPAEWEAGIGYLDGSGQLVRSKVTSGSGTPSSSLVSFSAGTKNVWVDHVAREIVDIGRADAMIMSREW